MYISIYDQISAICGFINGSALVCICTCVCVYVHAGDECMRVCMRANVHVCTYMFM